MGTTTTDDARPELAPGEFVDSDHPVVQRFADAALSAAGLDRSSDPTAKAVALFHAVRDGFRYDPYGLSNDPADYKASAIIGDDPDGEREPAWCVPKSVVLTAAARAAGIPARLGFADVKNHLTSAKLSESMGTDLFAWHGYSELSLPDPAGEGTRWFKLSTAFNIELCERFGVKVLTFDGTDDALMHAFDEAGNRHMEYVRQRGHFDDLPLGRIMADFAEIYPNMVAGSGASTVDEDFHG